MTRKPAVSALSAALFALGASGALALVAAPGSAGALELAASLLVSIVAGGALGLHAFVFQPASLGRARRLVVLAALVALTAAGAKLFLSIALVDPQRRYLPYLLPLAAAPML